MEAIRSFEGAKARPRPYNSDSADSNIDEFFKHEKETKGKDKKWSWVFPLSSFNDDQGGWYRLVILGERSDSEAKEVPMYDGESRLKKIADTRYHRGERREEKRHQKGTSRSSRSAKIRVIEIMSIMRILRTR